MTILSAVIGAFIGGGAGYLISKNLSRVTVGCPIMCNPRVAVPYFAFIGLLLGLEAFG